MSKRSLLRVALALVLGAGVFLLLLLGLDQASQWASLGGLAVAVVAWLVPIDGRKRAAKEPSNKQMVRNTRGKGSLNLVQRGRPGRQLHQKISRARIDGDIHITQDGRE